MIGRLEGTGTRCSVSENVSPKTKGKLTIGSGCMDCQLHLRLWLVDCELRIWGNTKCPTPP